jgi:hypothetical protein
MEQDRNKDQDSPRQSTMEPAEGSRENVENSGAEDRGSEGKSGNSGGGITNRGLDREIAEQEQLPDRGHSQSEG